MRQKLIAANWKMNKTLEEVNDFLHNFNYAEASNISDVKVLICPPHVYLFHLSEFYRDKGIAVGAQNVSAYISGAYTGEISASMLKSLSIKFCITGHSERRKYFGEEDKLLSEKINILLYNDIIPIYCCGELIEERKQGKHFEVVKTQIKNALFHLTPSQISNLVIAYEPVWAIGTGVNATPEEAQEMHAYIRKIIDNSFGSEISQKMLILYGGSCNSSNSKELFSCPDVDGGLVGGASLQSDEFLNIIKTA